MDVTFLKTFILTTMTCNVPISKEGVVKGYLEQQKNRIIRGFDKIATMHDHGRWPHPEIPSWQMLWILTIV